jgi:hypothetical protein
VAKPILRVRSGGEGRIVINGDDAPAAPVMRGLRERIVLTPAVQGESVSIAFDITSDSKQFRPSLVISQDIKGSFEWISTEGSAIRLTVSWID